VGDTHPKTAKPSPRSGVRLPLGAHPGNTGGKKGRSGRRPQNVVLRAATIVERRIHVLDDIAKDGAKDENRIRAIETAAKIGKLIGAEQVEHSGEVTVRVVYDGD
jgi:hypothetical protein